MKDKTALSLLELVIMLAVFALAAALCLRIFIRTEEVSVKNVNMDQALLQAQNAAETVKHCRGDLIAAAEHLGGSADGKVWRITFDDRWHETEEDTAFILTVSLGSGEMPLLGEASVMVEQEDGSVLAQLDVCWQEVGSRG